MAIIKDIIRTNKQSHAQKVVSADYYYDNMYFQISTYKAGDVHRTEGKKQIIQFDKETARSLIDLLNEFLKQK